MRLLVSVNSGPWSGLAGSAYEFVESALASGHEVMRVFFYHEGVLNGLESLTVATDAPDCDLAVRLTDVLPDGKSMLLADSIRRAKLRGSTDRPMPVTPGMPFEITITLPPVAQTFLPGHRIRISVAGSNWPRFERNPHTGADHFEDGEAFPAGITLRFGAGAPARLVLPVTS